MRLIRHLAYLVAPRSSRAAPAICACTLLAAVPAPANDAAHVHGIVRLAVAVDAQTLAIDIEAPLDSLLGFEHRPRTAAQRQAADAVLKQMNDAASLFRPDPAAQCTPSKTTIDAEVLQAAAPAAASKDKDKNDEHAELAARVEYACKEPGKLATIEVGLFDAFKRIRRIEAQTASAQGQSKQTLSRNSKVLKLRR